MNNFKINIPLTGVFCGRAWRCLCVSSLFQTEVGYDPEHQTCGEHKNHSESPHLPPTALQHLSDNEVFVLGDGPVYVRDDDAVVPAPQVDGGLTATGALVLCGHTEHHLVGSFTQV